VRTLRLKVKSESYPWLNAAAAEVNVAWNYANEVSARAAQPFAGKPKWLSAFDLNNLTAGATEYFEHIGSATIQRVNAEFATRRKQFKKIKLKEEAEIPKSPSAGCRISPSSSNGRVNAFGSAANRSEYSNTRGWKVNP
jgi:putative transposase